MPVSNLDIIKAIVLQEVEGQDTTENKPVDKEFILRKYEGLNTVLEYLMTPSYREYVTDVFIVAPKPTTFKIVLHNGQFFFLQFMGKAYEATVEGKKYYLMTIGEKERCMIAISRLLRFGNPLKTKGPEGAEQGTKGGEEAGGEETPPAETSAPEGGEEAGGEELTENKILESIIKKIVVKDLILEAETAGSTDAEKVLEILINIKPSIKSQKSLNNFLNSKDNEDAKFLVDYHKNFIKSPSATEVYYKALPSIPNESGAENLGTSNFSTTEKWIDYGGLKNASSKTDVKTDGPNFSVKNGQTKVRVLDASAPQLKALINFTIDKLGYKEEIKKELEKSLLKLEKLYKSEDSTLSRTYKGEKYGLGDLRKITNPKIKTLISNFDKNTNELNSIVNKIFTKAMENPKFKTTFINESLSGTEMFGKSSLGHADKILTYSSDFSIIKIHGISDVSKKIASNYTVPKFGTKSSGARISKTIQQFYQDQSMVEEKDSLNELLNKFDNLLIIEDNLINNSIILEDNVFNKALNYVKEKGEEILSKIFEFFNNLFNKIRELINTSINKALDFFGIELEIGEYNLDADIEYKNI